MVKVFALVGNMLMQFGNTKTRLMAIIAAFLLLAQATLQHFQTRLGLFQMLRVINLLTRRNYGKMFDANVNADRRLAVNRRFIGQSKVVINQNRSEITPAFTAANSDGFDFAVKSPAKNSFDAFDFGNRKRSLLKIHLATLWTGKGRFAAMLAFELRKTACLFEKRLKGSVQVTQFLLQRLGANLTQPRKLLLQFWQEFHQGKAVKRFALHLIMPNLFRQRPVVDPAAGAKTLVQKFCLCGCWIKTVGVRFEYLNNFLLLFKGLRENKA